MTDTNTNQDNVNAEVVAGRDVHYHESAYASKLRKLLAAAARELESNTEHRKFIDGLQRYVDSVDSENIVGLDNKLKAAGRDAEISKAIQLKEHFSKILHRHALSPSAQKVYAYLLANLEMLYDHKIRPLIEQGEPVHVIDRQIADDVLTPVLNDVDADNDLGIYHREVRGMMYYLAGQCHIKWTP